MRPNAAIQKPHYTARGDAAPPGVAGISAADTMVFYTPSEVAEILKVSRDTVIRKFSGRAGVIDIGRSENGRKHQYRTLRIPKEALGRFIVESRVA
jgi:hypothetical protein